MMTVLMPRPDDEVELCHPMNADDLRTVAALSAVPRCAAWAWKPLRAPWRAGGPGRAAHGG